MPKKHPEKPEEFQQVNNIGLYIHVPFCLSKCGYCDFYSESLRTLAGDVPQKYVNVVEKEARSRLARFPPPKRGAGSGEKKISSVYIGGGTPTVLETGLLVDLVSIPSRLAGERITEDCEWTCEANPGTVEAVKLTALRQAGVTRMSLGFQSLIDVELRMLGRTHSANDALESFHLARAVGFGAISVDLIFGIPLQSLETWKNTLRQVLTLGPEHISAYCLTLVEETPLAEKVAAGSLALPAEELQAEMYDVTMETLTAAGYLQYEISNFARPGCECRHNLRYWAGGEYIGLGASGHSHLEGVRSANVDDVLVYIEAVGTGHSAEAFSESLTPEQIRLEKRFLGLRTMNGVELPKTPAVLQLVSQGLLENISEDRYRLTRRGKMFADSVAEAIV